MFWNNRIRTHDEAASGNNLTGSIDAKINDNIQKHVYFAPRRRARPLVIHQIYWYKHNKIEAK